MDPQISNKTIIDNNKKKLERLRLSARTIIREKKVNNIQPQIETTVSDNVKKYNSYAFIDCGSYTGTIVKKFKENNPEYKIFAFECNPLLYSIDLGVSVTKFNKATWILDGELKFFLSKQNPDKVQGSSLYIDKKTANLDTDHPHIVPCIDFSKWLSETFTEKDYVIVKMNIEGAEYEVLNKCIKDGTIKLIKQLVVKWHNTKIPSISNLHNSIVQSLDELKIPVTTSYAPLLSKVMI